MVEQREPALKAGKIGFIGLLLAIAAIIVWNSMRPPTPMTWAGNFLAGKYVVQARDKRLTEGRKQVLDATIENTIRRSDILFSRDPKLGMVGELNASTTTVATVIGIELWRALDVKARLHASSGGATDPTIAPLEDLWMSVATGTIAPPSHDDVRYIRGRTGMEKILIPAETYFRKLFGEVQVTLDDVAHGYAADRLALLLDDHQVKNYFIDVNGAIRCANMPEFSAAVPVAKPPGEGTRAPVRVKLSNAAMATAGRHDGRIHIDPRSGYPVSNNVHTVAVVASTALDATALAETLYVMGPEKGLPWLAGNSPVKGKALYLLLKTNGALDTVQSADFPRVVP